MAETRRRLRSSTVALGSMGVIAAALTSCSSEPDRRCVDRDSYDFLHGYKVIADGNCTSGGASGASGSSYGGSYGARSQDPDWYYDPDVSGGFADDGTFSRAAAVDRGGIGCSASGSRGG
ncbi:hypothetical protein [Streptomyces poriticola]|uniref:hypothetical protein n=1 Tax=Streptomyces poriticola TaxID=3120506 RepID=UPI002FCDF25B